MAGNEEKQVEKEHILVVDDDRRIRSLVSRYLHEHGFIALTAQDAEDAQDMMLRFDFDALVVDVMMPGQSGMEFTSALRDSGNLIPVLLLTALGEVEDRVDGLEAGADDYLPKPFEPKELVLRLRAILRRVRKETVKSKSYIIGKWRFDSQYDEITCEDDVVSLTMVEANLLRALIESSGEVVTRAELANRCGIDTGERTIDVQMTRLRRKVEENTKSPRYLQTVRGKGYLLRAERE
ncbi:MAG: response regulator [Alphaproteobacteria bacterium]